MPEVPAHEKVLVTESFLADVNHGKASCVSCHGGDPAGASRKLAHVGLVADPTTTSPEKGCSCHADTVKKNATSLHTTLNGIRQSFAVRNGGTMGTQHETAFKNHCSRCHGSCGDCHVSVPAAAGGGLLDKHRFRKTPSMTLVCTACHGSRVGDEYRGQNVGIAADAHYNKGMQCTGCHTGTELHGDGAASPSHRYKVAAAPKCASCHPDDTKFKSTFAHTKHRTTEGKLTVSCQVCHSVTYKNCSSCHVKLEGGKPIYEVNAPSHESLMTFKIGLNPAPDALHPEKWILVRHVPADPVDYDYYGTGLLATFDVAPTWRLATPHNVQRKTPQNDGCTNCHGKRSLFLGSADLRPYETAANSKVVVPDTAVPAPF